MCVISKQKDLSSAVWVQHPGEGGGGTLEILGGSVPLGP